MKDCSIQLTNHPGDLARVAQALGRRGVNIKSLAAIAAGGVAIAHILPDDIVVARSALEAANIRFTESEVHIVLLENTPYGGHVTTGSRRRHQPRGALRDRHRGWTRRAGDRQ